MDSLSNNDKIALARQFNLVVRAINDYQIKNWRYLEEQGFKELIKKEKEILFFVEHLLLSSAIILYEEPDSLVIDVENFCNDLKSQLSYCKVDHAEKLVTRALLLASSISGLSPDFFKSREEMVEYS